MFIIIIINATKLLVLNDIHFDRLLLHDCLYLSQNQRDYSMWKN